MEKTGRLVDAVRTVLNVDRWDAVSGVDLLKIFLSERDESAFRTIIERYGGVVLRQCRRVLHRDDLCQEAFQETFQQLVISGHLLAWNGGLAGWLLATAKRRALNIARRERRQAMRDELASVLDFEPDTTSRVADREAAELVASEVARLPDRYRLPIELVYFEGKTHAEAAATLECPRGTVDSNVSRGLAKLRQALKRSGLPSAVLTTAHLGQPAQAKVPVEWVLATVRSVANLTPRSLGFLAYVSNVTFGRRLGFACVAFGMGLLTSGIVFWSYTTQQVEPVPPIGLANAAVEESLPNKNLRIFRSDVAPKLVAALAKLPLLDGQPMILEDTAYDSRVRCMLKCKNSLPIPGYNKHFHLMFHFDTGTRKVFVDIDPKADGDWRHVDPKRQIIFFWIPTLNYELVWNPDSVKDAMAAFQEIPNDPRAEAEVKRRVHILRDEMMKYVGNWYPVDAADQKCRIEFAEPLGLRFFRHGEQTPCQELCEEQIWRCESGFRLREISADGILGMLGFHLSDDGQTIRAFGAGTWRRDNR